MDQKGKEHIFMFAPENWTIADAPNTHNSCHLTIDALEDSVVIIKDKTTNRIINNIGLNFANQFLEVSNPFKLEIFNTAVC